MNKIILLVVIALASYYSNAQINELWGTTTFGGANNGGVIFKTDSVGENYSVQYEFDKIDAFFPEINSVIQADNGKLYGLVKHGGDYHAGVIFEYDINTKAFKKLFSFEKETTGKYPNTKLLQASNGKLYGTTKEGGKYNEGVLFEFDITTKTYYKLFDFGDKSEGQNPYGGLIEASDGLLYGTTAVGGKNDDGTVYTYNLKTRQVEFVFNFDKLINGRIARGELLEGKTGYLYGVTSSGGGNGHGTYFVYELVTDSIVKSFHFDFNTSGMEPMTGLTKAKNGKLYGLVAGGGIKKGGVLYSVGLNNLKHKIIYSFDAKDMLRPWSGLVSDTTGKLYGTTLWGGKYNKGTLFEFDPNTEKVETKFEFDSFATGTAPDGVMLRASNGKLYGMTRNGGTSKNGVLYEFNPSNNEFKKLLDFNGAEKGYYLASGLLLASNDKFYGVTASGGQFALGTLFEFDPIKLSCSVLHQFSDNNMGGRPYGQLIQASNGKIYGLATAGNNTYGSIFEFDLSTKNLKAVHTFNQTDGVSSYHNSLCEYNGKLYGMLRNAGSNQNGNIFSFDLSNNKFESEFSFDGTNGRSPYGSLAVGSGKLYGCTFYGGTNDLGTLFEYNPSTKSHKVLINFNKTNTGQRPLSEPIVASNGKLYGVITSGGKTHHGVLYEYDPSNAKYTIKHHFDRLKTGNNPICVLSETRKGILYGTTQGGGKNNIGVVFEYNINTDSLTKKTDMYQKTGCFPRYVQLVKRETCMHRISDTLSLCEDMISPSKKYLWTKTGDYVDTVQNRFGCDSIIKANLTITHIDTSVKRSGDTLTAKMNSATYQWIDCWNNFKPLDGLNEQTYFVSDNGSYAVVVSKNGCVDTSSCYYINLSSINNAKDSDQVLLYPNPNKGSFSIESLEYHDYSLELYNANGQLVKSNSYIKCNKINLNIEGSQGIYYLKLTIDQKQNTSYKIIKH